MTNIEESLSGKYKSLLETTFNTRELGGIKTEHGVYTCKNRFWRSDVQLSPNERDKQLLLDNGIRTILDMRTAFEVSQKPNGFCGDERFTYVNIPIVIGSGIPQSVEQVAVSYFDMTTDRNTMRDIFTVLSADGGIMFNCSAGKDRTGVVSAVLLMLAGAGEAEIAENYVLTKYYNKERLELMGKNYPDLDMNIVIPNERYMLDFIGFFKSAYVSADGYFSRLGISDKAELIREKMIRL